MTELLDRTITKLKTLSVEQQDAIATIKHQTNLPDHTQMSDSDGTFVKNFQEHPQSIVLTSPPTITSRW